MKTIGIVFAVFLGIWIYLFATHQVIRFEDSRDKKMSVKLEPGSYQITNLDTGKTEYASLFRIGTIKPGETVKVNLRTGVVK